MVPKWCFGVDSHTHTHTQTLSFLSSLILHHHANPACFTRQETERLIVIPQGSADLSQICRCLALHSSSFLHCLAPRNQKNLSSLGSTGNVGNLWVKPSPLGDSLAELRESLKGKAEQRWWRRQKEEGFTLFRAPEGYKAKAVLILRENAWPSWV